MIEWAQIEEAPDYYISNRGEVLSRRKPKERILKNHYNKVTGYEQICLIISEVGEKNVTKTFAIHRLVGKYHVANPKNLNRINHKDLNKRNNHHWNLEWVSQEENIHHFYKNAKTTPRQMRKIEVWDVGGNFIGEYPSINNAAKQIGCNPSVLWDSLTGNTKNPEKFIVNYIEE